MLGDGDGRFLAALLAQNTTLVADAVDTSAAMLGLLCTRCKRTAPNAGVRLKTHQTDALAYLASASLDPYDLIVTHFFLDCFTQSEVESLVRSMSCKVAPGAVWLISDFRIPAGALHYPARLFVGGLYLAFRLLTGLRTTRLPDCSTALASSFTLTAQSHSLFGLLTSELWTVKSAAVPDRTSLRG